MRRILSLLLMVCISIVCAAQAITAEQARQKAQAFFHDKGRTAEAVPASRQQSRRASGEASYYIYNAQDGRGFVIISGDEQTEDVLGYADEGTFDAQDVPANLQAWLDSYARQVEAIASGNVEQAPRRVATHAAVSPLVQTKWSQSNPYNLQCPTVSGSLAVTGCVATAMAQVMKYHEYPASAPALPSYTYTRNGSSQTIPATSAGTLDWGNMLNTYTSSATTAQQSAVAYLMRVCGQSTKMGYNSSASGTFTDYVADALKHNFGYDSNARFLLRTNYSASTWDELIYGEVASGRPVVYSGQATGGGHAFVCDGYDGQGYYHINWGWSGRYDGYFKLHVLNPNGGGIGSAGTEDGYAMNQGAVVGIQRPTGSNDDEQALAVTGPYRYDESTFYAFFANRTGTSGTFNIGFAYRKADAAPGTYQYDTSTTTLDAITTEGRYYQQYHLTDAATLGLSNGTWYFFPVSSASSRTPQVVEGEGVPYVEVVKSGSSYTTSIHPNPSLDIAAVTNASSGIAGMAQEIKVTLQETAGEEFYGDLYLFATKTDSKGDAVAYTTAQVEAGQTEDVSLYFTPASTGTWHLYVGLSDDSQYAIGPYDITIKAAPTGTYTLSKTAASGKGDVVTITVKNNSSQPYYRDLLAYLIDSQTSEVQQVASGNVTIESGASVDVDFTFSNLVVGRTYNVYLFGRETHAATGWTQFGYSTQFVVQAAEAPAPKLTGTLTLTNANSDGNIEETTARLTATVTNTGTAAMQNGYVAVDIYKHKSGNTYTYVTSKGLFMTLEAGATTNFLATFDELEDNSPYLLQLSYTLDEGTTWIDIDESQVVFTVSIPKNVTLTADDLTREYGDENPVLTYTVSGEGTLEGTPELSTEATATSPVGQYDIVVGKGTVTNTNLTLQNGTLTVTQAPLTVSVGNYSRKQGEANPTFVLSYDGFKNGEDESVFTTKPQATTTADADSPAGEYPITISGGEAQNYSFTYVAGTLTVTPATAIDVLTSSGRLFDVYNVNGTEVRHQTDTLEGLPAGIYVVGGRKVVIK